MKPDSPLFDSLRVKPDKDRRRSAFARRCDKPGCEEAGEFRAPKGRNFEGEYWWFCMDHVKDYNARYNYFSGMQDTDVAAYQKDAMTGHRPTWSMGVKGEKISEEAFARAKGFVDPFRMFRDNPFRAAEEAQAATEKRAVRNAERKALHVLGLDGLPDRETIKARFKALAKRHHPDVNGGDTSQEERLREVIDAYNYLKKAGLC